MPDATRPTEFVAHISFRPRCPIHRLAMKCGSKGKLKRFYYCPATECKCSMPMPVTMAVTKIVDEKELFAMMKP